MKADHAAQLRLLDLQAVDTALAQLAHRRRSLPEITALAERATALDALEAEIVDARTAVADIDDEQQRLDKEVEAVRARTTRDEQRLQTGGLPSRELESLQHEVATLARRQGSLEDDLLEVMQQREDAEATLARLEQQRAVIEGERDELAAARDAAFAEIDTALASRRTDRDAVAGGIPADLLAAYEKAREQGGGTGAAALRQRRCEGCRIELPGGELSRVRAAAADDVVRCENCRRILVRTAESGL